MRRNKPALIASASALAVLLAGCTGEAATSAGPAASGIASTTDASTTAIVGVAATSRRVYGACGSRNTRRASPCSTTRPALMT